MIQFLRGNKSQLEASQTIFGDGQPIFEKDTGQLKVGNGVDVFSSLPYVGASSSGGSAYPYWDRSAGNSYSTVIKLSEHLWLSRFPCRSQQYNPSTLGRYIPYYQYASHDILDPAGRYHITDTNVIIDPYNGPSTVDTKSLCLPRLVQVISVVCMTAGYSVVAWNMSSSGSASYPNVVTCKIATPESGDCSQLSYMLTIVTTDDLS